MCAFPHITPEPGAKQQAVNSTLAARTLPGKHHCDSAEVPPHGCSYQCIITARNILLSAGKAAVINPQVIFLLTVLGNLLLTATLCAPFGSDSFLLDIKAFASQIIQSNKLS